MYYYNARYYDPTIGTFISPDTIVPDPTNLLDYNRYMMVRGNPLKYRDPSGHSSVVFDGGGSCITGACYRMLSQREAARQEAELANFAGNVAANIAGFTIAGDVADAISVWNGYDIYTGEALTGLDYTLTGIGAAVPVVGGSHLRRVALSADSYMDKFAESVDAVQHKNWLGDIIPVKDWSKALLEGRTGFWQFDFPTALNNADEIHFNLAILCDDLEGALKDDSQINFFKMTNRELYKVLTDPAE